MAKILDYYFPLDDIEKIQRETGVFVEEFETEKNQNSQKKLKLEERLFFAHQPILIRKHRRFAPYPLHSHQFLEFNYMLAGESKQVVNGQPITLKEKQLLLLDTNSEHQLAPLGENDILINFLFKTDKLNLDLLKTIDPRSAGLTHEFIMNAIVGPSYHENYLLLDLNEYKDIQLTFEQMIYEFNEDRHLSSEILQSYVQTLFLQLSRIYHAQLQRIYSTGSNTDIMISVLQQIEDNYQDLSLNDLADTLGYNRNYLSNLIKKKTKKTFSQLMNEARMLEAHKLILTTNIPIESIALHVGISNKTQFYRKFREHFRDTPQNVRNMR